MKNRLKSLWPVAAPRLVRLFEFHEFKAWEIAEWYGIPMSLITGNGLLGEGINDERPKLSSGINNHHKWEWCAILDRDRDGDIVWNLADILASNSRKTIDKGNAITDQSFSLKSGVTASKYPNGKAVYLVYVFEADECHGLNFLPNETSDAPT